MVLGCDADVVDAACLAHDLGHPPFGHNGETQLAAVAADIGSFEGNAQTLRLLARLEAKRFHPDGRSAGLNLTRAVLDACCKYPWGVHARGPHTHKFGHYEDDAPVFAWLRQGAPGGGAEGPGRRTSMEAQVMDWSDDIAYSVHDVEDAVASGRVDLRVLGARESLRDVAQLAHELYEPGIDTAELVEAGERLWREADLPVGFDGSRAGLAALKDLTSRMIGRFASAAQQATREAHGAGPLVRYGADLVVPRQVRAECALFKALAVAYVMRAPGRAEAQEREREVVSDLVAAFLARPEERLDRDLLADWHAAADDAGRLRVVIDQVASLTDTRALALHTAWCAGGGSALSGPDLPMQAGPLD